MTALTPEAHAMTRRRIAGHAVAVSGLFDLLTALRAARDPREADVTRFMALLSQLIEEHAA